MRGLKKNRIGRGQTDTQTHGHVDSLTNSAQRAELVKMLQKIEVQPLNFPELDHYVCLSRENLEWENVTQLKLSVTPAQCSVVDQGGLSGSEDVSLKTVWVSCRGTSKVRITLSTGWARGVFKIPPTVSMHSLFYSLT